MNISCPTHKGSHRKLLIFFNGWGCNADILADIIIPDFETIILSDYTTLDKEKIAHLPLADYDERYLLAWSFGVFAANVLLPVLPSFKKIIAINGTPWPIDDKRGIPPRIFNATLENYHTESNRRLFLERVLGDNSPSPTLLHALQGRSIEDQRSELEALSLLARSESLNQTEHDRSAATWTHALISESDKIFPPRNMKRAWGETATLIPGEHYPDFQTIINQFILS